MFTEEKIAIARFAASLVDNVTILQKALSEPMEFSIIWIL